MYQDLHFYLDLNWEHYVDNPQDYLKQIYQLVEFVYLHKATVFYNQKQVESLVKNCKDLNEDFMQSQANILDLILKNAKQKNKYNYSYEIHFAQENTSLNFIKNDAISSISAHSKIGLISISEKDAFKTLLSVRSHQEFEKIQFNCFSSIKNLFEWIIANIPKRKFNLSAKHGENGAGHWKGESPLLCSLIDAQNFLDNAIPDFNKSAKQLYNFDDKHKTFIEFYYEGDNPQKQWHGFHIKKEEWESRIPKSIRKIFQK